MPLASALDVALLERILPDDTLDLLTEVGRTLSAKNETDLATAVKLINAVLRQVQSGDTSEAAVALPPDHSDPADPSSTVSQRHLDLYAGLTEGQNLGDWLESRVHNVWTVTLDDLFGAGHLTRDEYTTLLATIGTAMETYHSRLNTVWSDAFKRDVFTQTDNALAPFPFMMSTRTQESDNNSSDIEEATKTEDGKAFPASDFAYVPDPDTPSTWKLRLTSTPGGPPDARIVGAAAAALGPGFRGNRVDLPRDQVARVKARVRAAWRKANPDKDDADMPPGIRESRYVLIGNEDNNLPLSEAAVKQDGTMEIKIIAPGWGSSGYYPAEVLERDGPSIFADGTHMYFDHPTNSEDKERPERSVRDLAAVIVGGSTYKKEAKAGEGLYARAAVLEPYRDMVEALAPHIGVSIRGAGLGKDGTKDGRRGKIIEQLIRADSVDLVTHAGAGGEIVGVSESGSPENAPPAMDQTEGQSDEDGHIDIQESSSQTQEGAMTGTADGQTGEVNVAEAMLELARMRETMATLQADNVRMREQQVEHEAGQMIDRALTGSGTGPGSLSEATKQRLRRTLINQYKTNEDGTLDRDTFKTTINETIKDEVDYLIQNRAGTVVRGMGVSESAEDNKPTPESAQAALEEALKSIGLSDVGAAAGSRGRR